ncbi:MAG: bacteriohemerythrin [Pseudothermotoga sp.]
MTIQWSENLATGIDMIDFQHKHLFIKVDNLLSLMLQSKGKEEVCKGIILLTDYAIKHFCMEEVLMLQHKYNALPSQESEHIKFIEDLTDLKMELEISGAAPNLLLRIQRQLCSWLIKHIGNEDKMFGTFLKMGEYEIGISTGLPSSLCLKKSGAT